MSTEPNPTRHSTAQADSLSRTPVLAVILAAAIATAMMLSLDTYPFIVIVVLPLSIAAFVIGASYADWWWVGAPLLMAAPFLIGGAVLLVLGAMSSADAPSPMGPGGGRWFVLAIGTLLVQAGAVIGLPAAFSAAAGVWWAKRRRALQ